ncbi:PKD domain-containing protein [Pseudocnuella soli]|uniref:PKD domain-containing protein n=1 Tax=Pseudocnuella soli TaxID=2502779 RepID=UPI001042EEF2|nr:PKD domain-containing protein [Pseudocnuella soli]
MRLILLLFVMVLLQAKLQAQACNNPGQTPSTAFPVCGTSVFSQATVPLCAGRTMPSPSCPGEGLADVNPYYYKFTCFESGTLGFSIKPRTNSDDYDWEVYDITDRDPNDIYTDGAMKIASNWSGEGGETGAGPNGRSLHICSGFGKSVWSSMPQLQKGHNYLIMISHFTQSQSGYDLEFKGGTAVITDPDPPAMEAAEAHCSAQTIRLRLNKKLLCSSLASNGSDFVIMPGNHVITGASSPFCNNGFDTDSIDIRLQSPLDPGNYELHIKKGTDNNTLLDYCGTAIPDGQSLSFKVEPALPTQLDSIAPVGCNPSQLQLVFKKPVFCNTIAPNGSDFTIVGPYPVRITGAAGNCAGGVSKIITLTLSAPMQDAGDFRVVLSRNAGGGTIVDECGFEIPEGSVGFSVADTVSAAFTHTIQYDCEVDNIQFTHAGGRGITSWDWNLDDGQRSTIQNPVGRYEIFDTKNIGLKVTNGVCSDSVGVTIALANALTADFMMQFAEECPNEPVQFSSTANGRGLVHHWDFGDGATSTEASPVHRFAAPLRTRNYEVKYTVIDSFGCSKTATKPISIYSSCTIHVPTAFTPDGDGRNDVFRPLNVVKVDAYEFVVYNRWGQEVFRSKDARRGWNGTIGNIPQGTGTYVWMMRYREQNSGRMVERKGSFVLLR